MFKLLGPKSDLIILLKVHKGCSFVVILINYFHGADFFSILEWFIQSAFQLFRTIEIQPITKFNFFII